MSDEEVRSLLGNASAENLPLLVCMLCGLTDAELIALRVADLDLEAKTLSIPGEPRRLIALDGPLLGAAAAADCAAVRTRPCSRTPTASPCRRTTSRRSSLTSALDAALDDAQAIGPDTLRHTYIAHLVRQGLRFSDLGKLVGRVPAELLHSLAPLATGSRRVELGAGRPARCPA